MIIRIWHGWTTPRNASAYEDLLRRQIFPGIAARRIAGYLGIRLDKRADGDEVEFVTTMGFETLDAVRVFAGEEYAHSVVPDAARAVLSRYDATAIHYERTLGFDGEGRPVDKF